MKWNAGIEQGTVRKSEEKRGKERRRERGRKTSPDTLSTLDP